MRSRREIKQLRILSKKCAEIDSGLFHIHAVVLNMLIKRYKMSNILIVVNYFAIIFNIISFKLNLELNGKFSFFTLLAGAAAIYFSFQLPILYKAKRIRKTDVIKSIQLTNLLIKDYESKRRENNL